MKVLFYDGQVTNHDDDDPTVERLIYLGAETIPIEVFNGYERFADSLNTVKVGEQWGFTFDYVAQEVEEYNEAKDALDIKKRERRDGGFLVEGMMFDSDNNARIAYQELAMTLSADPTFSTEWKASNGDWVTMDVAMFQKVVAAGSKHIADTFSWYKTELEKI